ncbi:Speckle-type POZ protein-like protein [Leptotrombidium deliense]|uniref:Speckle-type POZ protein-like protein n=1 Tax=Leptotrombidium deliense TaxID=299467 RepID=A0A443S5R7_9ACAR|nr:Speckle-type POZ protein-like protein [Leptotrombidium deliense]
MARKRMKLHNDSFINDTSTRNVDSHLFCNWRILSFCNHLPNERLYGPIHTENNRQWQLILDPIEIAETSYGFLTIMLHLESSENIYFRYEISVLNAEGRVHKTLSNFAYFNGDRNCWGFEKFIEREELFTNMQDLINDCALTIRCKIRVFKDLVVPKNEVLQNIASLFMDDKLSDIIFRVQDKEFKAHKVILGVRSEVFSTMFTSGFKEATNNEVRVDDIDVKVFEELLRYIYTDSVVNIDDVAKGLLVAAEKYNLPPLKSMCEFALLKDLHVDNTLEYLLLADFNRAKVLKEYAIDLIIQHFCDIQCSEQWSRFRNCDKGGTLVEEIMKTMALQCAAIRKIH